jgi:hypothetical protein
VEEPDPSQVLAGVAAPLAQAAGAQVVLVPGKAQAVRAVPSQAPPQGEPSEAQAARPPWGWPAAAVQVPRCPSTSQASHWPEQAELQHRPSTQWPLPHWPSPLQAVPSTRVGVQTPPEQNWPDTQSAPVVQSPRQAVAPQT